MTRVAFALLLFAGALAAPAPAPLRAQGVTVAPPAVFIDHRTRSGSLVLFNGGNEPTEVTITGEFAVPLADSLGAIALRTIAEPDSSWPAATRWIEAYPRRVTVPPRSRQTVRLLARPPQGLADGEYWTRLVVSSRGAPVPVTLTGDTAGVHVGIDMQVNTLVAVFYRKGAVSTGVTLRDMGTTRIGDSLKVAVAMERGGNAAFIGALHLTLLDAAGRTAATTNVPIAVYRSMTPVFALPVAGLPPGRYTLRARLDMDRPDVDRSQLTPAPTVTSDVAVTLTAARP